jgi:hypothetical protein
MFVPPQGFRHAATLLIANGVRAIPPDASPAETHGAVERLAHDLVSLVDDMQMSADAVGWLTTELDVAIDRFPQSFDRNAARSSGASILARVRTNPLRFGRSDLFLIYAPHDRLPLAAPLAVELTKRRVSVAFASYEVATADEFTAAMAHGLTHHRGGLVLWTSSLERAQAVAPLEDDRVRVIRQFDIAAVHELVEWTRALRVSNP